jgi:hypothetical protein
MRFDPTRIAPAADCTMFGSNPGLQIGDNLGLDSASPTFLNYVIVTLSLLFYDAVTVTSNSSASSSNSNVTVT